MRKERSAFFQNQSSSYYYPNVPNQMSYPTMTQSNSNFYQGPPMQNPMQNMDNEFDTRISKIERMINRLDTRVTKLENESGNVTNEMNNNMYML